MKKHSKELLKGIKLNWWQAGLFKTSTVSFGILLALYFGDYLANYTTLFWITFIIPATYILSLYFGEK